MKPFRMVVWIALLVAALTSGCGQGSREEQGTGTTENSSDALESQARQETTQTPARGGKTIGGEATSGIGVETPGDVVRQEAAFTAASEMNGGSEGAADSIRGVRFGKHEGYERAVIDFGSKGASASQVPLWSLSSPTGEGYARITFPGVGATAVSNGVFGGSILDNFYVVRGPGGGMFVDIFATGGFQYRVTELFNPGRLVVDYHPASVNLSFPIPAQGEKTVLFQPRQREAITSPLRVSGYSRNFEASNTIMLIDSSGGILSQSTALSNDWVETWGYFEAQLGFPAFQGQATLRVGSNSPRDGSFEGVEVPVTYGGG